MALSSSFCSGGKSTRTSSPLMRSMGGLLVERCKSEAFCSDINLKKASMRAMGDYLRELNRCQLAGFAI